MRDAAVDAGFAVAERLNRVGLGGVTWRARRLFARLGTGTHSVDVAGLTLTGSLDGHGSYLRALSRVGGHPLQTRLLTESVTPGATVVDCGAHIGLQSMLAAREGGRVIAIEPEPANLDFLRANLEANGLSDRVEVIGKAVTDAPGAVLMHPGGSLDQAGIVRARGSDEAVDVPGTTLDEVLGERRFDVAKIDVEGAESLVLAGAEAAMARSSGATLLVECHPARLRDLGTDPVQFVGDLAERGRLELLDEVAGSLTSATPERIERATEEHPAAFGVRLVLD